jgi:hypothetical protein
MHTHYCYTCDVIRLYQRRFYHFLGAAARSHITQLALHKTQQRQSTSCTHAIGLRKLLFFYFLNTRLHVPLHISTGLYNNKIMRKK